MIEVPLYRNEKVAVLGLARSGLAAAKALQRGGARVLAWDDAAPRREAAAREGIDPVDLARADLAGIQALVLSPGIPHTFPAPHPVAAGAKAAGIPIIGDIELLGRSCPAATYAGITGTNGKSTTTALLGHILKEAGRRVEVGGNIGQAALELAPLGPGGIYVLEMSSYQLELTPSLAFDVAVLLNLAPDHLDRHGGMAGYIAAKEHIFANQRAGQVAIVGMDDLASRAMRERLEGGRAVVPISAAQTLAGGVYTADGWLIDHRGAVPRRGAALQALARLPGRHNWQNAAAAYAAARALGLGGDDTVAGLASFAGLAHRQELIATVDGVRYVNDSKATNAESVATAFECWDETYWIAGGRAKDGGIAALAPYFPCIRHAFLIGEAADSFAATLGHNVPHRLCGTLEAAVAAAHDLAPKGATVLLSPACASFDQFADFEARGERFRALVMALPGARA
ncbi:MAG: UDP-N-acetylmuramoyl-L-alanine--D-glutamate ligase [Stellaceae bacterium]